MGMLNAVLSPEKKAGERKTKYSLRININTYSYVHTNACKRTDIHMIIRNRKYSMPLRTYIFMHTYIHTYARLYTYINTYNNQKKIDLTDVTLRHEAAFPRTNKGEKEIDSINKCFLHTNQNK